MGGLKPIPSRCSSNKLDEVKEKRSLTLTLLIKDDDVSIGSGTNLSINNLTDETYKQLCKCIGVSEITQDTPMFIEIRKASKKVEIDVWEQSWGRAEKDLDDDQQSLPPE